MVTTSPWNRPARSITRADVARRAGTSLATVSYVLNDGPKRVSAAAREQVRRAIVELGYRPDQESGHRRHRGVGRAPSAWPGGPG